MNVMELLLAMLLLLLGFDLPQRVPLPDEITSDAVMDLLHAHGLRRR